MSNMPRTCFRYIATVKAGSVAHAMVQYVDVVPTLIEAAGGDPTGIDTGRPDANGNTGFDGRSFLDILLGKTDKHNDVVYGAHTTRGIIAGSECYPVRSIRTETHKYMEPQSQDGLPQRAHRQGHGWVLEDVG